MAPGLEIKTAKRGTLAAASPSLFPVDLGTWTDPAELLGRVQAAACTGETSPHQELPETGRVVAARTEDSLVLAAYCYLRGTFVSTDVVRRLDTDPELVGLRRVMAVRPMEICGYRRRNGGSLTECLARTLASIWRERRSSDVVGEVEVSPQGLDPFRGEAAGRVERSVLLDSMEFDY